MAIETRPPTHSDRTSTTRALLVGTGLAALPQLAFAAFLAIATWIDTSGMTQQERAESWADLSYFIAGVLAVPPVLALLLGGAAWAARERTRGVGFAIAALCIAGVPALLYLVDFVDGRL